MAVPPTIPISLGIPTISRMVQWKKIKVIGKEIPMMKDTGASQTRISKKLWKQIGQPKLAEKDTAIETYDKHKMKYLGASFSTVFYNNKNLNVNIPVVDADRNFVFFWHVIY